MTFRGQPQSQEIFGYCWCGGVAIRTVWSDDDVVESCADDIFHDVTIADAYVRVEVAEGRAYTYVARENPPLEVGEWVRLPGNEVHVSTFAGRVIRLLDGPDPHYDGPYKVVLGRLL